MRQSLKWWLQGVPVLAASDGLGLRLGSTLFGHCGVDGDRLVGPPLQDQDLAQRFTCLDRAEGPQFIGGGVKMAGPPEEVGLDDTGIGPGAVKAGHGDRLVDAAEAGECPGPPPVLEFLVTVVRHNRWVLDQIEQFFGTVEKQVDEWCQEVGAVVPAEAGLGDCDRVVQSALGQQHRGKPCPVPDPVVGGDGLLHHGLGLLGPAVTAQCARIDVQDGVRILDSSEFAQFVKLPVTCQQPRIDGEGVLFESAVPGYVLAEEPDCLINTTRALQHADLQLLCVGDGLSPEFFAAGLACMVCERGNQLEYPLVAAMPVGDIHQNGPQRRHVEARDQ